MLYSIFGYLNNSWKWLLCTSNSKIYFYIFELITFMKKGKRTTFYVVLFFLLQNLTIVLSAMSVLTRSRFLVFPNEYHQIKLHFFFKVMIGFYFKDFFHFSPNCNNYCIQENISPRFIFALVVSRLIYDWANSNFS